MQSCNQVLINTVLLLRREAADADDVCSGTCRKTLGRADQRGIGCPQYCSAGEEMHTEMSSAADTRKLEGKLGDRSDMRCTRWSMLSAFHAAPSPFYAGTLPFAQAPLLWVAASPDLDATCRCESRTRSESNVREACWGDGSGWDEEGGQGAEAHRGVRLS